MYVTYKWKFLSVAENCDQKTTSDTIVVTEKTGQSSETESQFISAVQQFAAGTNTMPNSGMPL